MSPHRLSDSDIEKLVTVPKLLPANYRNRLKGKVPPHSSKHEEAQLDVDVENVGTFRIVIRRNRINPRDFSIIFGYIPRERVRLFRLRRYNGVHGHRNKLERTRVRDFHIHYATQRYQEAGWDMDAYAEITDRYSTADQALEAMLDDCNFVRPEGKRLQEKLL